jgi:hypothetical protein
MGRRRNIREVLEALDWARVERMRVGSPDFVRARVIEESVQRLCERMAKGMAELPNCRCRIERQNRTPR